MLPRHTHTQALYTPMHTHSKTPMRTPPYTQNKRCIPLCAPPGKEADQVASTLGIHVLRHADKKPAGGAEELVQHFGCASKDLVMIGDRYFTDVVFGNRHGMLTVCPAPITSEGEPRVRHKGGGGGRGHVGGWVNGDLWVGERICSCLDEWKFVCFMYVSYSCVINVQVFMYMYSACSFCAGVP